MRGTGYGWAGDGRGYEARQPRRDRWMREPGWPTDSGHRLRAWRGGGERSPAHSLRVRSREVPGSNREGGPQRCLAALCRQSRRVAGRLAWTREDVLLWLSETRGVSRRAETPVKISANPYPRNPARFLVTFELPTTDTRTARNRVRKVAPFGLDEAGAIVWGQSQLGDVLRGNMGSEKKEDSQPTNQQPPNPPPRGQAESRIEGADVGRVLARRIRRLPRSAGPLDAVLLRVDVDQLLRARARSAPARRDRQAGDQAAAREARAHEEGERPQPGDGQAAEDLRRRRRDARSSSSTRSPYIRNEKEGPREETPAYNDDEILLIVETAVRRARRRSQSSC
jgi:hypothetical protein